MRSKLWAPEWLCLPTRAPKCLICNFVSNQTQRVIPCEISCEISFEVTGKRFAQIVPWAFIKLFHYLPTFFYHSTPMTMFLSWNARCKMFFHSKHFGTPFVFKGQTSCLMKCVESILFSKDDYLLLTPHIKKWPTVGIFLFQRKSRENERKYINIVYGGSTEIVKSPHDRRRRPRCEVHPPFLMGPITSPPDSPTRRHCRGCGNGQPHWLHKAPHTSSGQNYRWPIFPNASIREGRHQSGAGVVEGGIPKYCFLPLLLGFFDTSIFFWSEIKRFFLSVRRLHS